MFKKILIANRGEIAARIMRTARGMGIGCVAVYSEADARAPFLAQADEAICIGPAAAARSYLSIEAIIAACRTSGAEAVHPGYGFLAENAAFAEALEAAGIGFIGPNRRAIAVMGDKIAAKALARERGVPTIPAWLGAPEDAGHAMEAAAEIGYPVMLKAAAGGGGKGMRVARGRQDVEAAFDRVRSEAASAFGDDRIFIEKLIEGPRHIEIQLLGDKFGHLIHLGERECSLQRRHQKLIEEAPSPIMDEDLRARMADHALTLARAVSYDSVGTVEFLLDPKDGRFYFLEMNTRIQVEHLVTELVTGIDLIEAMIRIAAGEALQLRQSDVHLSGWAIESRVYAEDPIRGFMPSTGRLVSFSPPEDGNRSGVTVRIATGVVEGSDVSVHYDPMIAKLVTHAKDRAAAMAAHADALDQFVIEGVGNNLQFLAALIQNARVREGRLSTDLVAEEFPGGFLSPPPSRENRESLIAVAACIERVVERRRQRSCRSADANTDRGQEYRVLIDSSGTDVAVSESEDGIAVRMLDSGASYLCRADWRPGAKLWAGLINEKRIYVQIYPRLNSLELRWRGMKVEARVLSLRAAELLALMPKKMTSGEENVLRCPMPGVVRAVLVAAGQAVKRGDDLCIIEAMKMETVLRAERDAVIRTVHVAAGATLAFEAAIMEFM